jgi:hypothetical protein
VRRSFTPDWSIHRHQALAAWPTLAPPKWPTPPPPSTHDGVPWNNNNAEHAIKAFARLRRTIGGTSTAKGIEDYLILLSVAETCRARDIDVLTFFLSDIQDAMFG